MFVFVPLSHEDLAAWVATDCYHGVAFAATPTFLDAFGLTDADDEDADLTLASIASIQGLLTYGLRLVAVAEVSQVASLQPADLGTVTIQARWSSVTSLFVDEPESFDAVAAATKAIAGLSLSQAWDEPVIQRLVSDIDLLWHGPDEWQHLG